MSSDLDIVYLTKQAHLDHDSARQAGTLSQGEIEITPQMIEAGVAVLRREFGGQTEGANRFVDFPEVVAAILAQALDQASLQGA